LQENSMKHEIRHWTRAITLAAFMTAGFASTAVAVDPGVGVGKPGVGVVPGAGVGAPGVGVRDPGINQPGVVGNVGTPGVGAPGVGVVDPGLNQPGVAGNVGGVARRSVRR
jgi:hypothetical protein